MATAGFTQDSAGVIRDADGNIIGADPSAINTPGASVISGSGSTTAAVTAPAGGTDALNAAILKSVTSVLSDPKTGQTLANAAGAGLTAVENAFGIQTPQQQAAAAQQAAQAAQQQQQTMLIVGGVVLGLVLIGVTWYVMHKG